MDDLLNDFIAETRETLGAIAGEIVAWEGDPSDRGRLDTIFRFVHTVKGSCGFLELPRLHQLSHAAEDALAEVRSGTRTPDAVLVSAVLAVIDRIGELTDALETGDELADSEDYLIAALAVGAAPPAPAVSASRGGIVAAPTVRAVARSIRLPVDLLDRMMAGVSDMVLARNELARRLRDAGTQTPTELAFDRLSQCVGEMREAITRTRMSRIDTLFSLLPRMVRDLSAELGKLVALEVDGGDVELDRELIEMIRDPLMHIVRNSLDHGIERRDVRLAVGKTETGRLAITARQSGNQILIEIVDDGAGIDAERVFQKAMAAGIVRPDQAAGMSWARKLDLIFEPGLSTASAVTDLSGRGVGMDVVRSNIERIGGTTEIDSRPGRGLRLTLRVPLTLTIIPALTVSSAGVHFAIPRSAIDEIVRPTGGVVRLEQLGGESVAFIRGTRLPVVELARFMRLDTSSAAPALLIVLRAGGGERYALRVEAVHDHEELVVKPAAPALMASGIYAGTTLPDNSRPMLLLDVSGIAVAAGVGVVEQPIDPVTAATAADASLPTLLFHDLDGVLRGVRLALVERIEDVATAGLIDVGGRRMLAHQGQIQSLHLAGPVPKGERMRVLRLSDGEVQMTYPIADVVDVVPMPVAFSRAGTAGPVAGVALHGDDPVELLDAFWLFAEAAGAGVMDRAPPLCLVADGHDPWSREVLAPLLSAAGYRVSFAGEPIADRVSVVLAKDDVPVAVDAPLVRLRITPDGMRPGDDSIYRYDREGLLRAIDERVRAGASW